MSTLAQRHSIVEHALGTEFLEMNQMFITCEHCNNYFS